MEAVMRIPNEMHTSRPWRIKEIVHDFRLEDVWDLPGEGGPDDWPRLIEMAADYDPAQSSSAPVRALFALRWKLGGLLGLDKEATGVGSRVPTLRDRLPADLRDGPSGPAFTGTPFTSLFMTDDEFAAEVANGTMHGVLHFGRIPKDDGGFRAQMAIYVKPNGLLGNGYMALIKPFRYLIVYPALLREMGREWQQRLTSSAR
jgi:Protein of unknown function (DUF2867)